MMRICVFIYEWSKKISKILQDFVIYAVSLKKKIYSSKLSFCDFSNLEF